MANAPGPSRDDHDPGGDAAAAPDHPEELDAAELAGLDADRPDEAGVPESLGAARRMSSWQAELELAAVAELDARRTGPDGRDGEHVAEEIAAALTLTGRSARSLLEVSRRLERLRRPRPCWPPGSSTAPAPRSSPAGSP